MSPEAKASVADLARLLAEIAEDRTAMADRAAEAVEATHRLAATAQDPGALALAAIALHGWYTALETIFERIARQLDGSLPAGERWHRELLSQMSAEIPATRPAVIDRSLLGELGALLAFRHFFRHAYAVKLDSEHLNGELARLLGAIGPTSAALDSFSAFLHATMTKLRQA